MRPRLCCWRDHYWQDVGIGNQSRAYRSVRLINPSRLLRPHHQFWVKDNRVRKTRQKLPSWLQFNTRKKRRGERQANKNQEIVGSDDALYLNHFGQNQKKKGGEI